MKRVPFPIDGVEALLQVIETSAPHRLDRREFLRAVSVGAFVVASGGLLTGCGGASRDAIITTSDPEQDQGGALTSLAKLGGSRLGIQSVYFLALPSTFVSDICDTLNRASGNNPIEIEFSAAHRGGKDEDHAWENAATAMDKITDHPLNLVVYFGHLLINAGGTVSHSDADWGGQVYTNLFKKRCPKVNIVLETANEDMYTSSQWQTHMANIVGGLRQAWTDDPDNNGVPFPDKSLTICRCASSVSNSFLLNPKDKKTSKFDAELEYHYPDQKQPSPPGGVTVISNDGWAIVSDNWPTVTNGKKKTLKPLAYEMDVKTNKYAPLLEETVSTFKKRRAASLLLWHPALHLWALQDGVYHSDVRFDPGAVGQAVTDSQNAFLSLLKDFLG